MEVETHNECSNNDIKVINPQRDSPGLEVETEDAQSLINTAKNNPQRDSPGLEVETGNREISITIHQPTKGFSRLGG